MVCKPRRRNSGPGRGLVAVLLLVASAAHGQVSLRLSESSVAVGERISCTIVLDHEEPGDVSVPTLSLPGFRLVDGPGIRPRSRISQDQRSRVVEVTFTLEAVEAGRRVLPPIAIQVAGQVFATPERLVEVGERGNRERVPFLARWVVPDEALIVGETRAVYLEIYNADEFLYPSEITVSSPAQSIFEEVQGLGRNARTTVDGVDLYTIPVAVFLLTPSTAGVVQMSPATVEWEGLVATAPAASLAVSGAPEEIVSTGAVGTFDLTAAVDVTTVAATETVTLSLRLEGVGNLHYLQMPDITLDGLTLDSERRSERLDPVESGYTGYVEHTLVLRPTASGTARITVDQFAYFDPERRTVGRIQVPGVNVEITPVKVLDGIVPEEYTFALLDAEGIMSVEPSNWHRRTITFLFFLPGLLVALLVRLGGRRSATLTSIVLLTTFLIGATSESLPWAAINLGLERDAEGDLDGSLVAFEAAALTAPDSPGIQHNLAVLYFRAGDMGRSVYSAREAVRLNPRARPIRTMQSLVETAAGIENSVPVAHYFHPDHAYIVLAALVNVFCLLFAFRSRGGMTGKSGLVAIGRILTGLLLLGSAVAFVLVLGAYGRQSAVVLEPLSLRRIPSASAESWLDLPAGTAVDVVSRKDDFVLVRTELELEGWASNASLLWPGNPEMGKIRYRQWVH
jgi:hypothetical protein